MELDRLLEIAAERAMCDLCCDCGDDACNACAKVKGVTAAELREYHAAVGDALRRIAEHDKAREEGRLIILAPPAKEGDPKPDCFEERIGSLWCLGRQRSEQDDEPTDVCMQCWYCESGVYADDDHEAALGGGEDG